MHGTALPCRSHANQDVVSWSDCSLMLMNRRYLCSVSVGCSNKKSSLSSISSALAGAASLCSHSIRAKCSRISLALKIRPIRTRCVGQPYHRPPLLRIPPPAIMASYTTSNHSAAPRFLHKPRCVSTVCVASPIYRTLCETMAAEPRRC
jgi:hypothetical protein